MTAASNEATDSRSPAPGRTVVENVRETVESIVVAFILAFVFRAFIVEAFVIPTGSMAATLYGEHLTNTCSTCGYEYAVGITEVMVRYRQPGLSVCCPNCRSLADEFKAPSVARPDSGDRILVHKWPFDIGGELLGPKRWDVTVFKDPRDGTTNFIKRLVGLPGEVIEIIDGDVYAIPISLLTPEQVAAFEQLRRDVYAHWKSPGSSPDARINLTRRYAELNKQILPLLASTKAPAIQRKKPHETRAQQSLWFNVYNHDFLPNYAGRPEHATQVHWEPVDDPSRAAWKTDQREMTFQSDRPDPLAITLVGKEITDFYAYNRDGVSGLGSQEHVGDIRLRFVWFPDAGDGMLSMRMNRDKDEFTAELHVNGTVVVRGHMPESDAPGGRVVIDEKKLEPFAPGRAVDVEFINLDYRIYLFVNGRQVIASSDEQYSPRLAKLARMTDSAMLDPRETDGVQPSRVQIAASRMSCRLRHVVVERDVYYRSQDQPEEGGAFFRWQGWATAGFPILLRKTHESGGRTYAAEYFMLGDNSPASKDSRLWWEIGPHLRELGEEYQLGTVPEDQLIGKAFFVYWPAGYRPRWSPGIGLIPNVGRMRWIR